jgi:hemerythrin-like metal-binding protein
METGIENIDNQHKRLVEMINAFYSEIDRDSPKDKMLELLKGLKDYTEYHFEDEEALMRAADYPDIREHIAIHKAFVNKISDYQQRFLSGKLLLTLEVTNFIKDWIVKHIMGEDMNYVKYYNDKK